MKTTPLYIICIGLLTVSCQVSEPPSEEAIEEMSVGSPTPPPIAVTVAESRRQTFALTRSLSGTLEAARQMRVFSELGGAIDSLPVRDGSYVDANGLIAQLDEQALELELQQARLAMDRAMVEKKDMLISNGGDPEVDTSVAPGRLDLILTMSGFREAEQEIERVQYRKQRSAIRAPFAGLIADLQVKPYERISAGAELCQLIDPSSFEAVFLLLEQEALQLRIDQRVQVQPLTPERAAIPARITIINPTVNEDGLVRVQAALSNHRQTLFEGMNVQVTIEQQIPNQIVVPVEAVVQRSGRPVVFVYQGSEGRAKWNYVTIAYRNESHVAISEGIAPGDSVIVEGNLTLSHDARVSLEMMNVE